MEINLTPEQETRLSEMAQHAGKSPSEFLTEIVLSQLGDDAGLRVRLGLAQANAASLIEEEEEEEEMDARFEKMMRG